MFELATSSLRIFVCSSTQTDDIKCVSNAQLLLVWQILDGTERVERKQALHFLHSSNGYGHSAQHIVQ